MAFQIVLMGFRFYVYMNLAKLLHEALWGFWTEIVHVNIELKWNLLDIEEFTYLPT